MAGSEDFDQAEALAHWLGEQKGGRPAPFEKVESGDEQYAQAPSLEEGGR